MSSNLPLKKNWGSAYNDDNAILIRSLDEMYTDIALSVNNLVKKNILTGANPAANDQRNSFFSIGDLAIRTDTDAAWIMTSRTDPNNVVWKLIT